MCSCCCIAQYVYLTFYAVLVYIFTSVSGSYEFCCRLLEFFCSFYFVAATHTHTQLVEYQLLTGNYYLLLLCVLLTPTELDG